MKHVIIGNGAAGDSAAMAIRKNLPEAEILIITDEDVPFYYRPRLIDVVADEIGIDEIIIHNKEFYQERNIELHLSTKVTKLNTEEKLIETGTGEKFYFDKLLIATGAHSFVPPIEGSDRDLILTLRNKQDALNILELIEQNNDIILIGGGLLGLETGYSMIKQGKKVRVVEFFDRLLPKQLDEEGAEILQIRLEKMGFEFFLGEVTKKIISDGQAIEKAQTKSGKNIPGDLVIISAGVRSNVKLAENTPIKVDKAIITDKKLQTNITDIYAAGDCAIVDGKFYGIYPPAMEQGKVAGENMAGLDTEYSGTTPSHKLKVVGIDLITVGKLDMGGESDSISYSNPEKFIYKKAFIENGNIVGTMMLGDTSGDDEIIRAINEKAPIDKVRQYFRE